MVHSYCGSLIESQYEVICSRTNRVSSDDLEADARFLIILDAPCMLVLFEVELSNVARQLIHGWRWVDRPNTSWCWGCFVVLGICRLPGALLVSHNVSLRRLFSAVVWQPNRFSEKSVITCISCHRWFCVIFTPLIHDILFLPRDAMRKRGLCCRLVSVRLSARPSVCLSVTFVYCIQTAKDIVKLLPRPGSPIIFFWSTGADTQLQRETPSRDVIILWFSTEITVYLGNGTR